MENVFGEKNVGSRKVDSFRRFHRRVLSSGEKIVVSSPRRTKSKKIAVHLIDEVKIIAGSCPRQSEETKLVSLLKGNRLLSSTMKEIEANRQWMSSTTKKIVGTWLSRIEGKGLLIFFVV